MIIKWLKTILLASLVMLLVQCSPANVIQAPANSSTPTINDVQELEKKDATVTPGQPSPMNDTQTLPPEPHPTDSGLLHLVDMAKEDLSQRLAISVTQIILVEAKEVVWPDASLGCPQPGMKYKQVPEDGALIILQVAEINYEYHNGGNRGLFLCEKSLKDSYSPPELDILNLMPPPPDKNLPTPDNSIPPGEDQ